MYTLTNKTQGKSYNIILRDKNIGEVVLENGKWDARVGKLSYQSSSRKKSVEGVLYSIIMNQIGTERLAQRKVEKV